MEIPDKEVKLCSFHTRMSIDGEILVASGTDKDRNIVLTTYKKDHINKFTLYNKTVLYSNDYRDYNIQLSDDNKTLVLIIDKSSNSTNTIITFKFDNGEWNQVNSFIEKYVSVNNRVTLSYDGEYLYSLNQNNSRVFLVIYSRSNYTESKLDYWLFSKTVFIHGEDTSNSFSNIHVTKDCKHVTIAYFIKNKLGNNKLVCRNIYIDKLVINNVCDILDMPSVGVRDLKVVFNLTSTRIMLYSDVYDYTTSKYVFTKYEILKPDYRSARHDSILINEINSLHVDSDKSIKTDMFVSVDKSKVVLYNLTSNLIRSISYDFNKDPDRSVIDDKVINDMNIEKYLNFVSDGFLDTTGLPVLVNEKDSNKYNFMFISK